MYKDMLMRKRVTASLLTSLAFFGVDSHSAEFEVSLGVAAEQNSNPENLADAASAESEVEYAGILGVRGNVAGPYASWSSDLNYEVRRFSEHDEAGYELALGEADLTLGTDHSRLFAELSYSGEEELINERAGRSPENLDYRGISSARIFLRTGKPHNRFSVFVNAANVEYDEARFLESRQNGGGMIYQRAPSQTSFVTFEASGYSLEYKNNDEASFDYYLLSTSWHQALRKLQYQISLGANSIERDEKSTSPYFLLSADWREPTNRYSVSFRQLLTDTSQGTGRTELGDIVEPDGGRAREVDQYRFQEAVFAGANSSLCQRCTSNLRLSWQQEDYENLVDENNVRRSASLQFQYQPRRRLVLAASTQRDEQQVEEEGRAGNFTEQRFRVAAIWSQLAKRGRLELFAQTLEREFEDNSAFEQDLVGLRFDWLLYER